MTHTADGPQLLADFLEKKGLSKSGGAASLGVTRLSMVRWLSGEVIPSYRTRREIAEWTGGAVPESCWPVGAVNYRKQKLLRVPIYESTEAWTALGRARGMYPAAPTARITRRALEIGLMRLAAAQDDLVPEPEEAA